MINVQRHASGGKQNYKPVNLNYLLHSVYFRAPIHLDYACLVPHLSGFSKQSAPKDRVSQSEIQTDLRFLLRPSAATTP